MNIFVKNSKSDMKIGEVNSYLSKLRIPTSLVFTPINLVEEKEKFFTGYFDTLAGSSTLREQIISGMSAADIRASWNDGLERFRATREKYLLYD